MWPQTTQGHGQQQPSVSVVTTVWGVTSSMTNGTANMTHDPNNPGIPTTNTVNSVGHPYLSTSANPKQYAQPGEWNSVQLSIVYSFCAHTLIKEFVTSYLQGLSLKVAVNMMACKIGVYSGVQHCSISVITKIQPREIYVSEMNKLLKWLAQKSVNTFRYVDLRKKSRN